MALTDVIVEAGFGSSMFDASPTWTDISPYVRRASTTRGRVSLAGRFSTGTGELVLDNRDGRFNPDNTAGAYFPNVRIGTPIRIREGATPIFYGSARKWPPAYPKTQDSYVSVSLVDGFYNLNLEDLHGKSYPAQTTTERLAAVLDDISWPAALRDLDFPVATVQATEFAAPADGGEQPALPHLLDVAEAEVGVLYMSADGKVTFRNRIAHSGATASEFFTDSEMSEIVTSYDDDFFFNDIRVAREDGAQIQVVNATSVSTHGRRVLTRDVMPMGNDSEAQTVGEWLADIFGEQRLRIDSVKFKMHDAAPFYTNVLGLELRDYVNVTHIPPGGDTIDQDCAVEQIRHDMIPGDWTTFLSVAPLSELETQVYWQLGVAGASELGETTRLA
jgi:hypothetical protein